MPSASSLVFTARWLGSSWAAGTLDGLRGSVRLELPRPVGAELALEIDPARLIPEHPRLNTELRAADLLDALGGRAIALSARLYGPLSAPRLDADATFAAAGRTLALPMRAACIEAPAPPARGRPQRVGFRIEGRAPLAAPDGGGSALDVELVLVVHAQRDLA